jgi:hypothetical protein
VCYVIGPVLLLSIRALLARENARRDAEQAAGVRDGYDDVRVLVDDGEGGLVERKVDRVSAFPTGEG